MDPADRGEAQSTQARPRRGSPRRSQDPDLNRIHAQAYRVLGGDKAHTELLEAAYKELVADKARRADRAVEAHHTPWKA